MLPTAIISHSNVLIHLLPNMISFHRRIRTIVLCLLLLYCCGSVVTTQLPVTLPSENTLVMYYNGTAVIVPSNAPALTTGGTPIPGGVFGEYILPGIITDMNWTNFQYNNYGTSVTISMFFKKLNGSFTDQTPLQIAQLAIKNSASAFLSISIAMNPSDSTQTDVLIEYDDGTSRTFFYAPFVPNTEAALCVWNQFVFTRMDLQVYIYVNNVQQSVTQTGTTSVISENFYIAPSGHTIGAGNGSGLVDQIAIYSPALTPGDTQMLFMIYEPNCGAWMSDYGAPTPIVQASYNATINSIIISVSFVKKNESSVFYRLETSSINNTVCITSPNGTDIVEDSAGVAWSVDDSSTCFRTFTLVQSLSQIYDSSLPNNNWAISIIDNGDAIQAQLPLWSTYSVNVPGELCYTDSFLNTIVLQTVLVAYSQVSFTTADRQASLIISRVYLDNSANLVIQGTLVGTVASASFVSIQAFKGTAAFSVTPTNCYAPSGAVARCGITLIANWLSLNNGSVDIGGNDFKIVFNVEQNGAITQTGLEIDFGLDYTVPQNPQVVTANTIETQIILQTANSDSAPPRTTAYAPTDTIYLMNTITNSSPPIPSNFELYWNEGYLCCVPFNMPITPAYDPLTDSGGCKSPTGKTVYLNLGDQQAYLNNNLTTGISFIPATLNNNARYRLTIDLGVVLSSNNVNSLSCQILLISSFYNAFGRRRVSASQSDSISSERPVSLEVFDLTTSQVTKPSPTGNSFPYLIVIIVASISGAILLLFFITVSVISFMICTMIKKGRRTTRRAFHF
jgi:hypothetical protein